MINARKCVFLSEDASGIVTKVQFDPKSNQLIGLVLPLNSKTGMPVKLNFTAVSAAEIQRMMENESKSTLLYAIMAQPLIEHSPPFVLQIFGIDNKFKTTDVVNRWKYTSQELKRYYSKTHQSLKYLKIIIYILDMASMFWDLLLMEIKDYYLQ